MDGMGSNATNDQVPICRAGDETRARRLPELPGEQNDPILGHSQEQTDNRQTAERTGNESNMRQTSVCCLFDCPNTIKDVGSDTILARIEKILEIVVNAQNGAPLAITCERGNPCEMTSKAGNTAKRTSNNEKSPVQHKRQTGLNVATSSTGASSQ